jgi:hypothetical protein
MSPQKIINVVSFFNGLLERIAPVICLAILGAMAIMWADNRNIATVYASVVTVNDVILRVSLIEKDINTFQEQLDRIEGYAIAENIRMGIMELNIEKLKIYSDRQFRNK